MKLKTSLFASILAISAVTALNPGDMFLCSADGDVGDSGASGGEGGGSGGSTALTSGGEPVEAGEGSGIKVPSLGEAMYGDDTGQQGDGKKPDDKPADEGNNDEGKGGDWKEYVDDPNKTPEENAAAKAEHDKGKPAEKKDGDTVDLKPEDYEYVDLPDGFELDAEVDKEFRALAAEHKLPKEVVKSLTAMQVKMIEKQTEAHAATVAQWGEDLKTDKEVGGRAYDANMAKAREAKIAFFPPEVNAVLDRTGLGNHPAIVKGFVRIGKAMGELGTLGGKPVQSGGTILENLYGNE